MPRIEPQGLNAQPTKGHRPWCAAADSNRAVFARPEHGLEPLHHRNAGGYTQVAPSERLFFEEKPHKKRQKEARTPEPI